MADPRDVFIFGENVPGLRRMRQLSMINLMREIRFGANELFYYNCHTCHRVKSRALKRLHCLVCEDVNICIRCYCERGHPHEVEMIQSDLFQYFIMIEGLPVTAWNRIIETERAIKSLVHACRCHNWNCVLPSCLKTKRLIQHNAVCHKRNRGICTICNQLMSFAGCHAVRCKEEMGKCNIHLCNHIRENLKNTTSRPYRFRVAPLPLE